MSTLFRNRNWAVFPIVLLAGIGIIRIVATYNVFSQTIDEPLHIGRGLEWWVHGTYTVGQQHPPLAPIAIGLGPYLAGLRSEERDDRWKLGNDILYAHGKYFRNLALSRVGVLAFFLLSTFLVWAWSRRLFGKTTGAVTTALFTTLPPILAHSGLATTDQAITAALSCTVFSFVLWLEHPTVGRSFLLGAASGLAFLSKFSSFLFLPLCGLSIVGLRFFARRNERSLVKSLRNRWLKGAAITMLVTFVVVWAGYRFSTNPLVTPKERPHVVIDHLVGVDGTLHDNVYKIVESPIFPLTELWKGIRSVKAHVEFGHPSYLLGEVKWKGWWYFFLVALAVKTPIPFLILTTVGLVLVVYHNRHFENWTRLVPVVCAGVILLVCMRSPLNLGVRHVLPIYPFLAILAGFGALSIWRAQRSRILCRSAFVILLTWQFTSSVVTHPDYLAYFNVFADKNRENILIGSDLDWGQDLKRLSDLLKGLGVEELAIAYAGTADLKRHNLPRLRRLVPYERTNGWIAISLLRLKIWPDEGKAFSWLEKHEPVAMAGRSIKVYYLPENEAMKPQGANEE